MKTLPTGGAVFIRPYSAGLQRREGWKVRVISGSEANVPRGGGLVTDDVRDCVLVDQACSSIDDTWHFDTDKKGRQQGALIVPGSRFRDAQDSERGHEDP